MPSMRPATSVVMQEMRNEGVHQASKDSAHTRIILILLIFYASLCDSAYGGLKWIQSKSNICAACCRSVLIPNTPLLVDCQRPEDHGAFTYSKLSEPA